MTEETSVENKNETGSLMESLELFKDFLDEWSPRATSRGLRDSAKEAKEITEGVNFSETGLELGGAVFSALQAYEGLVEIWSAINDDSLSVFEICVQIGSGLFNTAAGFSGFMEGLLNASELNKGLSERLGKYAAAFNIGAGISQIILASISLYRSEDETEIAGNICDIISGALDIAVGGCQIGGVVGYITIPLGILSITASRAGEHFKKGEWDEGILTIIVGIILSTACGIVLKNLVKILSSALMKKIMAALNSTAIPFATNPYTVAIAVAIMIFIKNTLDAALSALFSLINFAAGGFPATGHPFIAREAGPELVGTLNGRTAVVNNDQIVEAVQIGVYGAFRSAMNDNSRTNPSIARVYLDGRLIASAKSA